MAVKKETASTEAKTAVLTLPELVEGLSYTGETVKIPRLEVPAIRVSYKAEDDDKWQRLNPPDHDADKSQQHGNADEAFKYSEKLK